jgi:hypothetical protein
MHRDTEMRFGNFLAQILAMAALLALAAPATSTQSMATRIEAISAKYLGAPYQLDPLGEGANGAIDRDPLIRFDVFDCQTYVETVIAEARASAAEPVADELRAIRYQGGVVDFGRRNHFPDADWIPHNVALGVVADISATVAGAWPLKVARTNITRRAWLASIADNPTQQHNEYLKTHPEARAELRRLAAIASDSTAQVSYIPKEALSDGSLLARIPSGSLIFIIRPHTSMFGRVGSLQNIAHMGFAIRRGEGLMYRHASSGAAKSVIDISLASYLGFAARSKSFDGIAVYSIGAR